MNSSGGTLMSGKKKPVPIHKAKVKTAEPAQVTGSKLRLAIILASAGSIMLVLGLVLGRGLQQGTNLASIRLFLLIVGFSLALAGLVGLLTHALVTAANKQMNRKH
jgi:hypothetical protein